MGKVSLKLQLVYFIDIFKDNHNIVRDRFVTDSVNVMKNRPFFAKKHKEISTHINVTQFDQIHMEIVTRNNNAQNFHMPYWLVTNCGKT